MLSALESGLAKSISSCDARYVIYLALVEHVQRPAGLALWDLEGHPEIVDYLRQAGAAG